MQGLRQFLDHVPAARGLVRFTQAGWANGDFPLWVKRWDLGDIVRFVGRLNQGEVADLVASASLLVAIDFANPGSTTIVSKLPDYVNARRPILAITAPSSSMGTFFNEDGAGMTAHYSSPQEVADCVARAFEGWQSQRSEGLLPSEVAIKSFSSERVLTELAGAFIIARRGRGANQSTPTLALPRGEASDSEGTLAVSRMG
jgi:hypothetical protein